MSNYTFLFSKQALKDIKSLSPKLKIKLREILQEAIAEEPYIGKKLLGEFAGNYSYRLTLKDRIVYQIDEDKKIIYIKRARTHYGE